MRKGDDSLDSNWIDIAFELKYREKDPVSWANLAEELKKITGLDFSLNKIRSAIRRDPRYKEMNKVEFEDIKRYSEEDVDNLFNKMIEFQAYSSKLDIKQDQATIRIKDTKPIGIAWTADWHVGGEGTDHELLQDLIYLMSDTDGLYVIGGGDYKDNYKGNIKGTAFTQIIKPGLQDLFVLRLFDILGDKVLAALIGCFLAGNKVMLANGVNKNIEDMEVGDTVVTHNGNIRKVVRKFYNFYDGEIVSFKVAGSDLTTTATANHPYLSVLKEDLTYKDHDRKEIDFNNLIQWREIGTLKEGDFLVIPKSRFYQGETPTDLMYVYGLYLAKGYIKKQNGEIIGVGFDFGVDEQQYADTVAKTIEKHFNCKCALTERPDKCTLTVTCYGKEVGEHFYKLLGEYPHAKQVNETLIYDKNALYLVAGFIDGDTTITTTSEALAYQLKRILDNHGIINSIRQQTRKNREFNDFQISIGSSEVNKLVGISNGIHQAEPKEEQEFVFNLDEYILLPIKELSKSDYKGIVYNLEVEDDHSYVVNNLAVHNCHDHWDLKENNTDFVSTICERTGAVNLWHGGKLNIHLGTEEYVWQCRHKFKYQSSLNYENAMRRLMEIKGPCDVAAEAHYHEPFVMQRPIMGKNRILIRSGSFKVWDDYGQKLAGYKGIPGIPLVILFPDRHKMIPFFDLEEGIKYLKLLRNE